MFSIANIETRLESSNLDAGLPGQLMAEFQPFAEAGQFGMIFQRIAGADYPPDLIKSRTLLRKLRNMKVSLMRWIE